MKTDNPMTTPYINCPSEKAFDDKLNLIRETLKTYGFCVLTPWDRENTTTLRIASLFGRLQSFPANDKKEGFISDDITSPHTDGAYLDGFKTHNNALLSVSAPKMIVLQHDAASTEHLCVVDAQKILKTLLEKASRTAQVLLQPGAVIFCGNDTFQKSHAIFEKRWDGRFQVRFRYDAATYCPTWSMKIIQDLYQNYYANEKYRLNVDLEPGQLLIIDNLRCLHGYDHAKPKTLKKLWINDDQETLLENITGKPSQPKSFESYTPYHLAEKSSFFHKPIIVKTGISLPYPLLSLAEQLSQRKPAYAVNYFMGKDFFGSQSFNKNSL